MYAGKVAVISGAASGMGRAYARALVARGARVALCDVDEQALAETLQGLDKTQVLSRLLDVSDYAAWCQFADDVRARFGPAHLVINNAGIEGTTLPVWASEMPDIQRTMDINFYGVVHGTKAFLPQLVSNEWAALVNVSSIFGLVGTPSNSDYCASKFAVRGFTEALMVELADVHPHVQVHLLHPGGINTNITRKPNSQAFGRDLLTTGADEIVQHVLKAVEKNTTRIVYGNQALRTYWASRLLPFNWVRAMILRQLEKYKNRQDYDPAHSGFSLNVGETRTNGK